MIQRIAYESNNEALGTRLEKHNSRVGDVLSRAKALRTSPQFDFDELMVIDAAKISRMQRKRCSDELRRLQDEVELINERVELLDAIYPELRARKADAEQHLQACRSKVAETLENAGLGISAQPAMRVGREHHAAAARQFDYQVSQSSTVRDAQEVVRELSSQLTKNRQDRAAAESDLALAIERLQKFVTGQFR